MIRLDNFMHLYSDITYLSQNPDFTKQLLITLNQVDGLSDKYLRFRTVAPSEWDWAFNENSYDNVNRNGFNGFNFWNDKIDLISPNREDLLKVSYYQKLTQIAKKYKLGKEDTGWNYYANDLVIQVYHHVYPRGLYQEGLNLYTYISVILDRPIDDYRDEQIEKISRFIYDISQLIVKDKKLYKTQFKDNYLKKVNIKYLDAMGITFSLKDFENPIIQTRSIATDFTNDKLKDVLTPESQLSQYLKANNLVNQLKGFEAFDIKILTLF